MHFAISHIFYTSWMVFNSDVELNLEEHCQHSFERYGTRGEDIHAWIDEPSRLAGASHRRFRHDMATLQVAVRMFGAKYGAQMVENIFLDHLRADSEDAGLQGSPKKPWTEIEDNFLVRNYVLSIEQLENEFQRTRTRKDIAERRKHLGIITPRYFKYRRARFAKLSFRLAEGQKLFMNIRVTEGGRRDIEFSTGTTKKIGGRISYTNSLTRFSREKTVEYMPTYTGVHYFNFSNLFSVFSDKQVEVNFHLENGRTMTFAMTI